MKLAQRQGAAFPLIGSWVRIHWYDYTWTFFTFKKWILKTIKQCICVSVEGVIIFYHVLLCIYIWYLVIYHFAFPIPNNHMKHLTIILDNLYTVISKYNYKFFSLIASWAVCVYEFEFELLVQWKLKKIKCWFCTLVDGVRVCLL